MTDRKINLPQTIKDKKFDKRNKKNKEQALKVAVEIYGSAPISLLQSGCTLNELKAYIAIDSFQGAGDLAFPKVEQLAKRAGMSVSACSMAISKLEENGWIYRKRNYGKANSYVCLVSAMTLEEMKKRNLRVSSIESARKNIIRYSEKQNDCEHSEKQNNHTTEKQNVHHSEKQGNERSGIQKHEHSEKQNDYIKDHIKRPLEKIIRKDQEILSLPDSDKIAIPSQSEYDSFKAEYNKIFLDTQGIESDGRQSFNLEQIAVKLKNDIPKLRLLFQNFSKSWYGVNNIRPTADKMLKFLTDKADALSMNFKGETTAAQRDKFGGDDSTVQKIADQAIRRAEDGAREYLANGGLIF